MRPLLVPPVGSWRLCRSEVPHRMLARFAAVTGKNLIVAVATFDTVITGTSMDVDQTEPSGNDPVIATACREIKLLDIGEI